jgi:hypothetical protein
MDVFVRDIQGMEKVFRGNGVIRLRARGLDAPLVRPKEMYFVETHLRTQSSVDDGHIK